MNCKGRVNAAIQQLQRIFMSFVWIWEQTQIVSLYSINWLVFITETKCLLRGTDRMYKYNSPYRSDAAEKFRTAMTNTSAD